MIFMLASSACQDALGASGKEVEDRAFYARFERPYLTNGSESLPRLVLQSSEFESKRYLINLFVTIKYYVTNRAFVDRHHVPIRSDQLARPVIHGSPFQP
jgi:hypothetical protein